MGQRQARVASREIVVRFRSDATLEAIEAFNLARGARLRKRQPLSGIRRIALPLGADLNQILLDYRNHPLVEEAGPNLLMQALEIPDDPGYLYQWHLKSSEGGMWAEGAWQLTELAGQGVVVAVIDTGVAYENYDGQVAGFPQRFRRAPDLAATLFIAPWDFANGDAHANDDNGHGTHVTGSIAQSTGNGLGLSGVASSSTIMPLKVLDYAGSGYGDDLVEAIYYAVDHGARVINLSLGFPGSGAPDANGNSCTEVVGLNAALDYAQQQGVVVVAAAGNDGGDTVLCPAAHPSVIAVAANRFDGEATFYSNQGDALDLTAPGGDPNVDQNGDGFEDGVLQEAYCYDWLTMLYLGSYDAFCQTFYAGTSMASPHVAGAAALLLAEEPTLAPDHVRYFLESTARRRGGDDWNPRYGWGALNAGAALAALLGVPEPDPTPGPAAPTDLTATAVSSSRIELRWTDNATTETGFKLERSLDGVTFT